MPKVLIHRWARRMLGLALAAIFASTFTVLSASSSQAATACPETRSNAASLASSGNFVEPYRSSMQNGTIILRYSSDSACAWALTSGSGTSPIASGKVWIERSNNGGATWQGPLGSQTGLNTYSATINTVTSGYDTVRACAQTWFSTSSGVTYAPSVCTPPFYPGRLYPNGTLGAKGYTTLWSQNNVYSLVMQGDGNLVLYSRGNPVWASNTANAGNGTVARMQGDGNLVVIAPGNHAAWASGTSSSNSVLFVQSDGNVVIYAPGNHAVWATNTAGR